MLHNVTLGKIRPIDVRVSILVPFGGRESIVLNDHLKQDILARFVNATLLIVMEPLKWIIHLETFEDMYLADYFMDPETTEDIYIS